MDGRHVAFLEGGDPNNYFLQNTRVATQPNTVYSFTAALGVRDNPAFY